MSQLLDMSRETASAASDGGMRELAAGQPIGGLQAVAAQILGRRARSSHSRSTLSAPEPERPIAEIGELSVQQLTRALALSQEHLAGAMHHIQRMLANNVHLQALVLERTREMEVIQDAANHDDLTGLFNRRMLPERLDQALAHAEEHRQLVALVMFDLDGFKHVNDRFGHAAGDLVLRIVARRIETNVSGCDTVCRYGGDEFVLILPDMDGAAAQRTVDKIEQQIAEPCMLDGYAVSLTVSAGVAMYPRDGKHAAQLLEAADAAMYRHKPRLGRKPITRLRWFMTARGEETRSHAPGLRVDKRP